MLFISLIFILALLLINNRGAWGGGSEYPPCQTFAPLKIHVLNSLIVVPQALPSPPPLYKILNAPLIIHCRVLYENYTPKYRYTLFPPHPFSCTLSLLLIFFPSCSLLHPLSFLLSVPPSCFKPPSFPPSQFPPVPTPQALLLSLFPFHSPLPSKHAQIYSQYTSDGPSDRPGVEA